MLAAITIPQGCDVDPGNPCGNGETIQSYSVVGGDAKGTIVDVVCLNRGGNTHVKTVHVTISNDGK
jgi:hypothetical protein